MTETTYEYPPLRRAIADAVREQQHDEVPAAPAPLPHPTTTVEPTSPHGELVNDVDALLAHLEQREDAELDGQLAVRALLLEVRRARQEAARVTSLRDAVTAPYDIKLEQLSTLEARIRNVLDTYLKRAVTPDAKGSVKVSIPDAGSVYLTTKNAGGKAKVNREQLAELEAFLEELADAEALKRDARDHLLTTDELRELYTEQLDTKAALELLLTRFYDVTPAGHLVRRDTGELEEVPGIEVAAEVREVAVRLS
jgi:hypothetical protein